MTYGLRHVARLKDHPRIFIGKRMQRPQRLGSGKCVEGHLGQAKIVTCRDLEVEGRAFYESHQMPELLDELRLSSSRLQRPLPTRVGVEQQLAAEDLRRLGGPQPVAARSLQSNLSSRARLQRTRDRSCQDRGPRLLGGTEHAVDPFLYDQRASRVMNGDEIGLRSDALPAALRTRIGSFGAPRRL